MKKILLILLLSVPSFLLTGCFSKNDLKEPIKDYLSSDYGIKDDIKIVSASNAWLAGVDHETVVEIMKPYRAYPVIYVEMDTHQITKNDGDDIFLELFKGAYIEQHPEVMKQSERIIKQYNLVAKSPDEYNKMRQNYYYYLKVEMDLRDRDNLLEEFKKKQKIDTVKIIPTLGISYSSAPDTYEAIINFEFYYNTYKNDKPIPQAQTIVEEFKKSHVLSEGFYLVRVNPIEATENTVSVGLDERATTVRFHVDKKGDFKIIEMYKGFKE